MWKLELFGEGGRITETVSRFLLELRGKSMHGLNCRVICSPLFSPLSRLHTAVLNGGLWSLCQPTQACQAHAVLWAEKCQAGSMHPRWSSTEGIVQGQLSWFSSSSLTPLFPALQHSSTSVRFSLSGFAGASCETPGHIAKVMGSLTLTLLPAWTLIS